jgi:ABC-type sugar transport system substrate-binding protein
MLIRRFFLLICLALTQAANAEDPINVTFLVPASTGNSFWETSASFAKAVADDLGINLTIAYTAESTYKIKRLGDQILTNNKPMDYLLTAYLTAVTEYHLEVARDRDAKVLLFNTNIPEEDRSKIGAPREKYKNWIGHMSPDDIAAGYALADALINRAKASGLTPANRKPEIIGLTGADNTNVSFDRNTGLERRVKSYSDAILHEIRFSDWERKSAELDTLDLLKQKPGISIIWAASDSMAFGAIDALNKIGAADKDVVIGGIDWSAEGIAAVADGRLAATVGGHFMEAGWALILVHDYHHGIDFRDDTGVNIMTTMSALDGGNIKEYLKKSGDGSWSTVDFKNFSKYYNPKLSKYNFSINALIEVD